MQLFQPFGSTSAARASESKTAIGDFSSAHFGCVWKSDSCSSQNLPCTPAHIAASAAACAFVMDAAQREVQIGEAHLARLHVLLVDLANVSSCHCLQKGHWKSLTSTSQTFAVSAPRMRARSASALTESVEPGQPVAAPTTSPGETFTCLADA